MRHKRFHTFYSMVHDNKEMNSLRCVYLQYVVYLYICSSFEYARESSVSQEAKTATLSR